MYVEKLYEMILIVKYRVEVLFMVTRIFILDDSLVFEKMLVEILEESRILLSPWKFEIVQGLGTLYNLLNSLKIMKSIPQIFFS